MFKFILQVDALGTTLELHCSREASTLTHAVVLAMVDVRRADPEAILIGITI